MSGAAWDDIPLLTLSNKLLGTGHGISGEASDSAQDQTCEDLARQLDNNLSDSDISDWIGADSCDPGYQVLTDQDIIEQVGQACTNPQLPTENESNSENEDSISVPTNTTGQKKFEM